MVLPIPEIEGIVVFIVPASTWTAIFLGSSLAIAIGFVTNVWSGRGRQTSVHDELVRTKQDICFSMKGGRVTALTPGTRRAFGFSQVKALHWPDLRAGLALRFADLPRDPPDRSADYTSKLPDDPALFRVVAAGGEMQCFVVDRPSGGADLHIQRIMMLEMGPLRALHDIAPGPIWQSDAGGQVIWSNMAYQKLAESLGSTGLDPDLFPGPFPAGEATRACLKKSSGDSWFEVRAQAVEDTFLHFAVPIDPVVRAERAQRNFVQTLTKTFAHLPIGLAIFDKDRRLVLFNPAMIDLTALPAEFLTSRPDLMTFFDKLRDARMMPEPRDYICWRDQITELICAAADDRYSETWSLPSGLTYRITGRPHPDGAIAFLIEDISTEISLTRRFQAELAQSQSVLDSLRDAIAVFSPVGVLTMANIAYRTNWGSDPDAQFDDILLSDEVDRWSGACHGGVDLERLRDRLLDTDTAGSWTAAVQHVRLGPATCFVTRIQGGNILLRFGFAPQDKNQPVTDTQSKVA